MKRMYSGAWILAVLSLGSAATASALPAASGASRPELPAGTIQFTNEQLQWREAPPSLPPGTRIAVLEGDPKAEGLFTLRLEVAAGTRVAPHWHPRDERVTVLSGAVSIGFGDVIDTVAVSAFRPGGYYVNPPFSHHFVLFKETSIIQITGMGPWELHYLE